MGRDVGKRAKSALTEPKARALEQAWVANALVAGLRIIIARARDQSQPSLCSLREGACQRDLPQQVGAGALDRTELSKRARVALDDFAAERRHAEVRGHVPH